MARDELTGETVFKPVVALIAGSEREIWEMKVETINTYDEYGMSGSGNAGRFQYAGQAWLPEAGVYALRARAYAPGLGRFLQPDPIGYSGGANLYSYVGADPVNWTDPLGLSRISIGDRIYSVCIGPAAMPDGSEREVINTVTQCSSGRSSRVRGGQGGYGLSGGRPSSGIGGTFPGAGFSGPPIQNDPTYAPFQVAYQDASRDNWWMAIPALAPAALPIAVDLLPYAVVQAPVIVKEAEWIVGPRGPLFGTRYGGNRPFFNSNRYLRIGWGWKGSAAEGRRVFRISGNLVRLIKPNNPHIEMW